MGIWLSRNLYRKDLELIDSRFNSNIVHNGSGVPATYMHILKALKVLIELMVQKGGGRPVPLCTDRTTLGTSPPV